MNILKQELIWIKGRCYRKNPIRSTKVDHDETENDLYPTQHCTRIEDDICDVDVRHDGTKFWTTIPVPSALFSVIVGKSGNTRKHIERDTRTKVMVPRASDHSGDIVVSGENKQDVALAYRKIEDIATRARWRQQFTHFISFPMNFDTLKESFSQFKNDVLTNCKGVRGLEADIFQNPDKLHLTVATMVLLDDREREKAAATLQKCREELSRGILQGQPLTVRVEGIEYMNDDPSEVDVLYAKVRDVEEYDRLQTAADYLITKFKATGLMREQYENVKLHITLLNTLFRSDRSGFTHSSALPGQRPKESFDARPLLEKYLDYHFGVVTISAIHISVLHSVGTDGHYCYSAVLKLPPT